MSWKTILIKSGEQLNLFLENLVINSKSKNYQIPLDDIDAILIENYKTMISTRVLNKFAQKKIITIFCDVEMTPISILQPFDGNYQQAKIMRLQLEWSKNQKLSLWTKIVRHKIESQIDVLKMNLKNLDKIKLLYSYIEELKFSDSSNREGHAAKVYFKELFGNKFTRDLENHVNAGLNFGYAIIRGAFIRTIVAKGLHPTISLFHHNMYNSFALADDLMEPFRPIVDNYVYNNIFLNETFTRTDKLNLINLLNCQITIFGQKYYLNKAIEKYVESAINYFEVENYDLQVPIISSVEYYEL